MKKYLRIYLLTNNVIRSDVKTGVGTPIKNISQIIV